jgi:hypothetical protein
MFDLPNNSFVSIGGGEPIVKALRSKAQGNRVKDKIPNPRPESL